MDFDRLRDVARERLDAIVEYAKDEPKKTAVIGVTALLLLIASVVMLRALTGGSDGSDGPRPSEDQIIAVVIELTALRTDDRFNGVHVRVDDDVASVSGEVDASAVRDLKASLEAAVALELPGARLDYVELRELPGR